MREGARTATSSSSGTNPTPSALIAGGALLAAAGVVGLAVVGHGPNATGILLGVPFGLVTYATIVVGENAQTTSQRIAPFGMGALMVVGTIALDVVVSGTAAIAVGAVLVVVGVADRLEDDPVDGVGIADD
jgi:hypothetical protein